MKTCEICDRQIRTGRKYCWEHRCTAQAEALRGNRIIDEATEAYIEYRISSLRHRLYTSMSEFYELEEKTREQATREIENRDPKYIKWVKEWVQEEKKEKEFRKSLLK